MKEKIYTIRNITFPKAIILLCLISFVFSCKKDDSDNNNDNNQNENFIPVNYYMTSQDKSLFDFYYSCKTILFSDSINNHLVFHTDTLYDLTTHQENDLRDGEMLQMAYGCQSNYFPNYSINLLLTVYADSSVCLEITFATGTYWPDQNNDYVLSTFILNPEIKSSVDTINYLGYNIHQVFYDSITIQSKKFYNVFYTEHTLINTDIKQTIGCYYTNNKGVIAFKNHDDEFWIRE